MNILRVVNSFQRLIIILSVLMFSGCFLIEKEELSPPPPSPLLSRSQVGYAVVTVSYIHILDTPDPAAVSLGYLRQGSIVDVLERRSVRTGDSPVSWLLIKGTQEGWLQESHVMVYNTRAQAETASELYR